ncbi:hypothetical protein PYR74_10395 [Acinetobacter bereziniae]|nr:hypothetical protein PYR74_10395 [Acinetobacter bereziniae]
MKKVTYLLNTGWEKSQLAMALGILKGMLAITIYIDTMHTN